MATLYVENVPDDLYEAMILANRLTWMCWAGCYDALMARRAIKARVEAIFTWNIDYFRRVGGGREAGADAVEAWAWLISNHD
jgi:hypothetical protein